MDRDITEALVPVTDINLHFTVLKDFLVGLDTSVIDIFVADIDTLVVPTEEEVIEGMVACTGVVDIDTSVVDNGEAAIATDKNGINIKRAT